MAHISIEFCENHLNSFFCITLLTNKQTNADDNITAVAEVKLSRRIKDRTAQSHHVQLKSLIADLNEEKVAA